MAVRTATAVWQGSTTAGKGTVALGSGAFEGQYSFASRFESGTGTNPEELIGAAHAGCFSMALSATLGRAGFNPTSINTTAKAIPAFVLLVLLIPVVTLGQRSSATTRIPKEIVNQITADGEGDCGNPKLLKATWVDLNGDHVPELIVKQEATCACGAGGNCTQWVYKKTDAGYVVILDGESAFKLYPATASSNGFKDLISEHSMGASEIAVTIYKWSGNAYKQSSCLTRMFVGTQQGKPIYKTKPATCAPNEPEQTEPSRVSPIAQNQPPTFQQIAPPTLTVGAGKYTWFRFVATSQNARVVGRLQATGGSGNDLEVFILGQDEFTNFQSGHNVNTWYKSGRVTVTNVNAVLPPGTYYLIFSNTFSMITPKAVSADIKLIQ